MSEVRPDVDLSGLARPREDVERPRRGVWRWLLPLVVLGTFAAVIASTVPELFERAREVTVARPRPLEGARARAAREGTVVAQAAGWVEPDPFPIEVVSLAPGVVQEVLVQESDRVARGQVVARLIDEDARLAHEEARAMLAVAAAEVAEARASLEVARRRFDAALEVTERERVTAAELEGRRAESEHRAAAVRAGEARVRLAQDELVVQRELDAAGAAGTRQVELAAGRVEEEQAQLEALLADAALARAQAEAAEAAHARALGDVEHRFEDRLALEVAEARLERARAEERRVQVTCDVAALRLARVAVLAPSDGVVLERMAQPGSHAGPVCTLYDPRALRVRVDVPLADVARLFVGQRAEVLAGSRPEAAYAGEVLRLVELADIQKVTLEAQVRLSEPDELVRPDMLVQVRFLARSGAGEAGGVESSSGVLVPSRLVDGDALWVIGADGRAERRAIARGGSDGEWTEVLEGVQLTDKLIDQGRAGLVAGTRVRVAGGR